MKNKSFLGTLKCFDLFKIALVVHNFFDTQLYILTLVWIHPRDSAKYKGGSCRDTLNNGFVPTTKANIDTTRVCL